MSIKAFIKNQKLKTIFGKYVNPKVLDSIVKMTESEYSVKKEEKCGFAIIDVSQDDNFEDSLVSLIDFARQNEIMVYNIMGSIVFLCTYSPIPGAKNDPDCIYDFIECIPGSLNEKMKIAYGVSNAKTGNYGSKATMTFMVLLDSFGSKVNLVSSMKYGEKTKIE